jgi:hypothetical protein
VEFEASHDLEFLCGIAVEQDHRLSRLEFQFLCNIVGQNCVWPISQTPADISVGTPGAEVRRDAEVVRTFVSGLPGSLGRHLLAAINVRFPPALI